MAYVNLLNQACIDKKEAFCRLRDFICKRNGTYDYSATGIGWTLFDSSYAVNENNPQVNDWIVLFTPGEDGTQDIYLYIKWVNNVLFSGLYQSWDSTTHTGSSNSTVPINNLAMSDSMTTSNPISIYGDLDCFVFVIEITTTTDIAFIAGTLLSIHEGIDNSALTVTSGSITAGVGKVIGFGSPIPANWVIGVDIYIRTTHTNAMATVKMEKARITAFTTNSITVTLVNSYTAGSKVSIHMGYFCSYNASINYIKCLMAPDGVLAQTDTWSYNSGLPNTEEDPDSFSDAIGIYSGIFQDTSGCVGYSKIFSTTPTHNAAFTHKDVLFDFTGKYWRCRNISSNYYAILEV